MNIVRAIASFAISLTVITAFWVFLDDALMYKEDSGVIPALWIGGFACHLGFLGILYYHLKGWGVIDINWWKNFKLKIKRKKK